MDLFLTSMESPKITVIVPVYNVAAYIEKCAVSLFEQTLDSLEILFVDDCSPDNSVEIIKETLKKYPARNSLTRIIRMPSNGGQAAVRRQGIIEATGQYIIHCDGDDWVDLDLYERLYDTAVEKGADIVVCDEIHECFDGSHLQKVGLLPEHCKDVIKNWYKATLGMFCHNKLVKRSLYTKHDILPWVGLNMWEDNGLLARLFYYGDKLAQIHGSCYHYNRTNINAMTSGYGIRQVEQMIGIAEHLTEFFGTKKDAKELERTVLAFQYLARINLVTDSFAKLRRYNNTFKGSEAIIPYLDLNAFSNKGRFRFRMVKYHLGWLFVLMFKVKNLLSNRN